MALAANSTKNLLFRDLLCLVLLSGFVFFWGLGRGSLASWDEAYYAIVARGILRSGDWVRLTFFGGSFYDKPPLYFWATALFWKLFGEGEFGARFFSAAGGAGAVLALYGLGRRWFGRLEGLAAALVLLSTKDFIRYARFGTLDVVSVFFFILIVWSGWEASRRSGWWYGFWAASALLFMTKGGLVVLPWGLVLFGLLILRRWKAAAGRHFVLGAVMFVCAVLPWHWAAYQNNPEMFLYGFFYKHYVLRTGSVVEGHAGGWYFYFRSLVNKAHPWVVVLPFGAALAVRNVFYRSAPDSADSGGSGPARDAGARRQAWIMTLMWAVGVFLFFTFGVKTKLAWYLLPAYPAFAMLSGLVLVRWWFQGRAERVLWVTAVTVLAVLALVTHGFAADWAPAVRQLAPEVRALVPADGTVFLYDYHEQPAALYYFERSVEYADSLEELDGRIASRPGLVLLVPSDKYRELEEEFARRGFVREGGTRGLKGDLDILKIRPQSKHAPI